MSDLGAVGKNAPVDATETQPRTGGYLEQWRRELEEACERYVTAARSTGRESAERAPPQPDGPPYIRESVSGVPGRRAAGASLSAAPSGTAGTAPSGSDGPGTWCGARAGVESFLRSHPRSMAVAASPPRPGPAPGTPAVTARGHAGRPMPAAPGVVPEASSVRLLQAGGRLHLVVRDAALEPDTLLRLVGRIRTGLDAAARRLTAITLNGECIWQSGDDESLRPAADVDRAVDRHY